MPYEARLLLLDDTHIDKNLAIISAFLLQLGAIMAFSI
jgi:hypothetical protein